MRPIPSLIQPPYSGVFQTGDRPVGAYYFVGGFYELGIGGVEQDLDMARYWYMRSIDELDDQEAYIGMARLALAGHTDAGSFSDAADYLRKACNQDDPRAWVMLGSLYHKRIGVEKDLRRAAQLYDKSIEHGYVLPMIYLSKLKFEEGAYLTWILLRLKASWKVLRIAWKNQNDERLWDLVGD